jgi:6-phosphogluconolactonase (cycloisomerase 2 family)
MTTYDIGGVQLAENSAQAIMTQYTPQGAIVYNCQLGADAVYAFARFSGYWTLRLTL